jgi:hypothetical protein
MQIKNITFFSGINKSAPLWMQHIMAALTILIASKSLLIDGIPGIDQAVKALVGQWFDYATNWVAIIFSIATVFSQKAQKI